MKIKNFILFCLAAFFATHSFATEGKDLFHDHCALCHSIGKGLLVGPDLVNINSIRSEDWLLKWTKSSLSLIQSGDTTAISISNKFNNIPMADFAFLSDDDIKSIYQYVQKESGKIAPIVVDTTLQTPTDNASNSASTIGDLHANQDITFNYLWIGLIVVLFLVIILGLVKMIRNKARQKK